MELPNLKPLKNIERKNFTTCSSKITNSNQLDIKLDIKKMLNNNFIK